MHEHSLHLHHDAVRRGYAAVVFERVLVKHSYFAVFHPVLVFLNAVHIFTKHTLQIWISIEESGFVNSRELEYGITSFAQVVVDVDEVDGSVRVYM